jgi:hypothetical protein
MEVDSKHSEYAEMESTWQKCRDTSVGARAVKARGSKYLPRLGGQTNDKEPYYLSYKERAQFFNAVNRTIDTMGGHIFRKQPVVKLPTVLEGYQNDIDMEGTTLEGFISKTVDEVIEVTRYGILVDHPLKSEESLTEQKAQAQGYRPYLAGYKTENIINWKTGRVNNATVLTQVFLTEAYEDNEGEKQTQIRELLLDGVYTQNVYREVDGKWLLIETTTPQMQGKSLSFIPFYFVGSKEGIRVQDPVLENLADICLGFYRNSADYEQALHVAGSPTPWVNGITEPETFPELHLGANSFLKLPPDAEAGFLQCGSDGVKALREAMQEKKLEMASQGAKMLESDKAMAESAEAHSIKRGAENSILASIAGTVEKTIEKALRFMAEWAGADPDDVSVELNKDYLPSPMDAQTMREWREMYLNGVVSFETFFEALIAGEAVSEGLTAEDEIERKANQEPALGLINDDQ